MIQVGEKILHKLVIIAVNENTIRQYASQVRDIFGDLLAISVCKLRDLSDHVLSPDCTVLIFGKYYYSLVASLFPKGTQTNIVVAQKNVNVTKLKPIMMFAKGEKFLVINDHPETTAETAKQLNDILFEYTFIPYDMYRPIPKDISYIVTPDEQEFVPKTGKKIIDIGQRVLSLETFLGIYNLCKLKQSTSFNQITTRYIKSLINDELTDGRIQISNPWVGTASPNDLINEIEKHGFLNESIAMLDIYSTGKQKNIAYGRLKLQKLLEKRHIYCSEQQIRIRTKILDELGLITVRKGRAGSTISNKGEDFLRHVSFLKKAEEG